MDSVSSILFQKSATRDTTGTSLNYFLIVIYHLIKVFHRNVTRRSHMNRNFLRMRNLRKNMIIFQGAEILPTLLAADGTEVLIITGDQFHDKESQCLFFS